MAHPFLLIFFCVTGVNSIGLEELLLSIENGVDGQTAVAGADYARWTCGLGPIDNTEIDCFFDGCRGAVENKQCSSTVKSAFGGCAAGFEYVVADFNKTRITHAVNPATEPPATQTAINGEIMWTAGLTGSFVQENAKNAGASWQYIGTPYGTTRLYPAVPQETCFSYDPRLRPWYVAATSGPKDVVIVIDVSGSMGSNNRIQLTKEAVASVLTTLTINDYVAIVSFNDKGRQLCGTKLVQLEGRSSTTTTIACGSLAQATSTNKEALRMFVNELYSGGGTNFLAGMATALPIFQGSAGEHAVSSGCSKAVLFLTDGMDQSGIDDVAGRIAELNAGLSTPAVLFTYSLGVGASHAVPKQLACDSHGIWSPVDDQGDIRGQMSHFYDYFSAQRANGDSKVSWVEPYIDAYGAGLMTTASKALYDATVSPPRLIGVIGIDILMKDIKTSAAAEGASEAQLLAALARRSASCIQFDTSIPCTLATLRSKDYSQHGQFSRLLGNSATGGPAGEASNRLCPTDPTECAADDVRCAGTSFGVPQTLSTVCPSVRGSYRDELCLGPCAEPNGLAAGFPEGDARPDSRKVAGLVGLAIAIVFVVGCIAFANCTNKQHCRTAPSAANPGTPLSLEGQRQQIEMTQNRGAISENAKRAPPDYWGRSLEQASYI